MNKKQEKEVKYFIKFLKKFFKANDKERNLILCKIYKQSKELYFYLGQIRDLNKEEQEQLYLQLMNKEVNKWL